MLLPKTVQPTTYGTFNLGEESLVTSYGACDPAPRTVADKLKDYLSPKSESPSPSPTDSLVSSVEFGVADSPSPPPSPAIITTPFQHQTSNPYSRNSLVTLCAKCVIQEVAKNVIAQRFNVDFAEGADARRAFISDLSTWQQGMKEIVNLYYGAASVVEREIKADLFMEEVVQEIIAAPGAMTYTNGLRTLLNAYSSIGEMQRKELFEELLPESLKTVAASAAARTAR
ncbi:MAG: hypothetical protein NTV32_05380 [Gammaproteobacteria bacterium]|nr:hypothetical protein [Gammaproteobacteria bacterium]